MGAGLIPTPVPTPVLFPWEPDGSQPIDETWHWITNVITSTDDSEQRIGLRVRPALTLKWTLMAMSSGDAGRLMGQMYANPDNYWYVPMWPSARGATAIASGVYTLTNMTATLFQAGAKALVWQSPTKCDLMTVSAVSGTGVTLSGTTSFTHLAGMMVVPINTGVLTPQRTLTHHSGRAHQLTVEFTCDRVNSAALSVGAAPQSYLTIEVLPLLPSAAVAETEAWIQSQEVSGGDLGLTYPRKLSATPIVTRPRTWVFTTQQDIADARAFLARRRGRKVPCWVPSFTDDFDIAVTPTNGATTLDITAIGYATAYADKSRKYIAVLQEPNVITPFKVTGVTTPSAGIERLALSANLPSFLTTASRVCVLALARLSEDAITLSHVGPGLATMQASFVEVPREVAP